MSSPLDFYFDFSSPYGYIAATQIDSVAAKHDRAVNWRPFLIGIAMKATGASVLTSRPMLNEYASNDMPRSARFYGVPFRMPDAFPISSVAPSRAFYWLEQRDRVAAIGLAKALYNAYWAENTDISGADAVADIAATLGHDRDALLEGIAEQTVKDRLRDETTAALERGVFGSPFVFVDDEGFWGADRLWQVERWLQRGGW